MPIEKQKETKRNARRDSGKFREELGKESTLSRALFQKRELAEFCDKLAESCEKLGEFVLATQIIG